MKEKLIKGAYLSIALISLAIGCIGIVVPILPTTPFLLLTLFCFSKGSKRFHDWFITTKIYKKHLKSFYEKQEMTLKKKIILLSFASSMLLIAFFLAPLWYVKLLIVLVVIFKYYYFIFRIKTI